MKFGILTIALLLASTPSAQAEKPQYEFQKIVIPAASATEPKRKSLSFKAALDYLEKGAAAWSGDRKCVSCHTNGTYMHLRPGLTKQLGPPSKTMRAFFESRLKEWQANELAARKDGLQPTKLAYLAVGLAEWDRHVTGKLSKPTDAALRVMLSAQSKDGSMGNITCWPPYESSSYHGATIAAMAVHAAPGWLKSLDPKKDKAVKAQVAKLERYLKKTKPPHDYAGVLKLWTSIDMPGLVDAKQKLQLIAMILKHQQSDGGWSIRTFAKPEQWGDGKRAKRIRKEPDFKSPPSDGHMTGLAVVVLREAGVPASDKRIARAIAWIKRNQQQSGRWWTRSLNTDRYHYITYSGTMLPVAALIKCGVLPAK